MTGRIVVQQILINVLIHVKHPVSRDTVTPTCVKGDCHLIGDDGKDCGTTDIDKCPNSCKTSSPCDTVITCVKGDCHLIGDDGKDCGTTDIDKCPNSCKHPVSVILSRLHA